MSRMSMKKTITKKTCGLVALLITLPVVIFSCVPRTAGGVPQSSAPSNKPATPTAYTPADNKDGTSPNETIRFFEGDWTRTNVIRYAAAVLTITDETEAGFDFDLTAYWGDHTGQLSGEAIKISTEEAVFRIDATDLYDEGVLRFSDFGNGQLCLSFEGDLNAADFGKNVLADGLYVKGEPEYESDGYPMLVFGGEVLMEKTRALMMNATELGDDTAYENLLTVMREGLPDLVGPGWYKGFMSPARMMGADLFITPDEHICLMAYGLDERPYVFYTTDIQYHGWLRFPEYLELEERVDSEEVVFVYSSGYSE